MIRLHCKAQTYHWGKKGLETLVGRCYLASVPSLPESAELYDKADKEHYAELWIGDHPNGPAEIIVTDDPQLTRVVNDPEFMKHYHHKDVELSALFKLNPERFLGHAYVEHFSKLNPKLRTQMAFLFKLLAVNLALSIQAHPHKSLAEQLHKQHPDIYKDDNHKPEIAIALSDDFQALFGFLKPEQIRENLHQNKMLGEVLGYDEGHTVIDENFVKQSVHRMFYEIDKDLETLQHINTIIMNDILAIPEGSRSEHQKMFLTLKEQYGLKDIGLLFLFFFNIMKLKRDDAVVITPNEPHAYISGDLVECMANSDNVVRGGLTPKLKDKETLYHMLPYNTLGAERKPVQGNPVFKSATSETLEYKTGFEEFRVFKAEVKPQGGHDMKLRFKTFSMAVVINGSGHVHMPGFSEDEKLNNFTIERDCAYYIMPDQEFSIINDQEAVSGSPLTVFIANCDI